MKRLRPYSVLVPLLFAALPSSSVAQAASADATNIPVFRSEARVVVVDVVATDPDGKPLHGLKARDFQIYDNGKQQTVRGFDEHTTDDARVVSVEKPPVLAPGVYSNWTPAHSSGAVNIVLFDTLNMDWQDQAYARRKMIEYLKTLPPGQQVALFTLGNHLQMVQALTGSSDTLIAAASRLGALSAFAAAAGESQNTIVEQMGKTTPASDVTGSQGGGQSAASAILQTPPPGVHGPESILQDFLNAEVRETGDLRIRMTLEALRDLARSLATVPGRKNLIWVSGSFPAMIGSYTELSGLHAYDREIRTTAALLAAHQIAVYPIDARGLMAQPAASSAQNSGRSLLGNGGSTQIAYAKAITDFAIGIQSSHAAMDEMAQQTGGRAFYNSNDISNAIEKSIDSGANYYTVSYTPANKIWDGRLRTIEVKVARNKVKLTYRRGYYAVADPFAPVLRIKTTDVDVQKRLIEAVQPNTSQSSEIRLEAKVVVSGPEKPVEIQYLIDGRNLTLPEFENGTRKVSYQLVAVAWDTKQNNSSQAWEMVDKEISAKEASDILARGINSHRFLTLKPGTYKVYVGVIDVGSKKIGTLAIPLEVPKAVSALK